MALISSWKLSHMTAQEIERTIANYQNNLLPMYEQDVAQAELSLAEAIEEGMASVPRWEKTVARNRAELGDLREEFARLQSRLMELQAIA